MQRNGLGSLKLIESALENMSIRADAGKRRLYFAQNGVLDKDTVIQSYHLMLSYDGFDTGYDRVVDYRKITSVNLNALGFKEIISEGLELSNQKIRAAVVIGDFAARLVLLGVFCELSNIFSKAKVVYKPIRTIEAANDWLDLKN